MFYIFNATYSAVSSEQWSLKMRQSNQVPVWWPQSEPLQHLCEDPGVSLKPTCYFFFEELKTEKRPVFIAFFKFGLGNHFSIFKDVCLCT